MGEVSGHDDNWPSAASEQDSNHSPLRGQHFTTAVPVSLEALRLSRTSMVNSPIASDEVSTLSDMFISALRKLVPFSKPGAAGTNDPSLDYSGDGVIAVSQLWIQPLALWSQWFHAPHCSFVVLAYLTTHSCEADSPDVTIAVRSLPAELTVFEVCSSSSKKHRKYIPSHLTADESGGYILRRNQFLYKRRGKTPW